jgi:hypothetical protein
MSNSRDSKSEQDIYRKTTLDHVTERVRNYFFNPEDEKSLAKRIAFKCLCQDETIQDMVHDRNGARVMLESVFTEQLKKRIEVDRQIQ